MWERRLQELVGEQVRRARDHATPRVTQYQLAGKTSGAISRSSIANIEKGRQGMSLFQLYAVADALGLEATSLLPKRADVFDTDSAPLHPRGVTPADAEWVERILDKDKNKSQP